MGSAIARFPQKSKGRDHQRFTGIRDVCSKKEFFALLQKAAEIIEKEIGKKGDSEGI